MMVLLTALVGFGPLSTDLYLPCLPLLVSEFKTDAASVQLTLSVYMAGFALAQLVYGSLSDCFGRRPVLVGGLVLYIAASLLCLLAQTIEQLILARLIQAFGACAGPVLGRAVVRDLCSRDQAAQLFAYMAMAMTLAPAIAPVIGGALTEAFGWPSTFLFLAAFGVIVLAVVLARLAETNHRRDPEALQPRRLLANYLHLLGDRDYLGYVLSLSFIFCGLFAFISGSSFVLIDRLGLTPPQFGFSFAAVVLGYMGGSVLSARLTRPLGLDRLIVLGVAVSSLAGLAGVALALAGVVTWAAVVGPMMLFMVGTGLVFPNASAGAIGPHPTMAGLASALMGCLQMLLAAVVGAAVGQAHDGSALPMMAAVAGSGLAAALAYHLLVRRRGADAV